VFELIIVGFIIAHFSAAAIFLLSKATDNIRLW